MPFQPLTYCLGPASDFLTLSVGPVLTCTAKYCGASRAESPFLSGFVRSVSCSTTLSLVVFLPLAGTFWKTLAPRFGSEGLRRGLGAVGAAAAGHTLRPHPSSFWLPPRGPSLSLAAASFFRFRAAQHFCGSFS